jgi:hypothetical protein
VAGELHAFLRHAVELWCGCFAAKGADVRVAEVVDVDEDEVRRGVKRREEPRAKGEEEGE